MASLQTLDIKSNEVSPLAFRVLSMRLLDGTSAPRRSKPMKIARRPAPFTRRTRLFAMTRPEPCRPATTLARTIYSSQSEGRTSLPAHLQRSQGVPFPRRYSRHGLQGGDQRADLLPEQPERIRVVPEGINPAAKIAEGLRFS